ncbi:MAG TPA: DUF4260 domain-containing protein [Methylocella sp.]|nr:DUF4260 domain-containing protein [Methylocella sp.]
MISSGSGSVNGAPRLLLRAEGFAIVVLCGIGFAKVGASWWLFALLILVPDLSILAYFAGPRTGAITYNAAHTYLGPLVLLASALLLAAPGASAIALIWGAHIGLDRALGLGLKYPEAFAATHLGRIGK